MLVLCLLCTLLYFLILWDLWTSQYCCVVLSTKCHQQVQAGNESAAPDVSAGQAEGAVEQQNVTKQARSVQPPDQHTVIGQQVQEPEYGNDNTVAADNNNLNAISADTHQDDTSAADMHVLSRADDSYANRVMLDLDDEMEGLVSSAADPVDRVMLNLDDEMEGLTSAAVAETDVSVAAVLAKLSEPKVEAAPEWSHAEVLMAEQAVEAAQLAEGKDSSALNQPEGVVIQLEQYEPTAEEDASQHLQLKHIQNVHAAAALSAEAVQDLDAVSEGSQPMQPGHDVDGAE